MPIAPRRHENPTLWFWFWARETGDSGTLICRILSVIVYPVLHTIDQILYTIYCIQYHIGVLIVYVVFWAPNYGR